MILAILGAFGCAHSGAIQISRLQARFDHLDSQLRAAEDDLIEHHRNVCAPRLHSGGPCIGCLAAQSPTWISEENTLSNRVSRLEVHVRTAHQELEKARRAQNQPVEGTR